MLENVFQKVELEIKLTNEIKPNSLLRFRILFTIPFQLQIETKHFQIENNQFQIENTQFQIGNNQFHAETL